MRRSNAGLVGAAAVAGSLLVAGPASAQLDLPSFYANPQQYLLYSCPQLAQTRPALVTRIRELEGLMAKAESGPGGRVASTLAYKSDYLAAIGSLQYLDKRIVEKGCPPPQAVVVPESETPPAQRRSRRSH
jgi:hypothetical protein